VKEKDLSDAHDEGYTDHEKDGLRAFNSGHPFFNPIGSPFKKHDSGPEIILVEDSGEESAEDEHEVDEEDRTGEAINKILRVERWNGISKYAFGLYLLCFIPLWGSYDDIDPSLF
jgi:hypothetical protein